MPFQLIELPPEIICRIIQHISFDPNLTRNLSDLFQASTYLLEVARYVVRREPSKYMLTVGFAIKVAELEQRKGKQIIFYERQIRRDQSLFEQSRGSGMSDRYTET